MSLLDRRGGPVGDASAGEPAVPHHPSDKPVEIAAAIAERESLRAGIQHSAPEATHGFLRSAHLLRPPTTSRPPARALRASPYVAISGIGCCALTAAIGGTSSALVAAVAFTLAAGSALLVALDRPPSMRALYARFPGTATGLHVAVIVRRVGRLGRRRRASFARCTCRPPRRPNASKPKRERPRGALAREPGQLGKAAHASVDSSGAYCTQRKDWKAAAAALAEAATLVQRYKDAEQLDQLDAEVLKQLEAAARAGG